MDLKQMLVDGCRKFNISLSNKQIEQFFNYYELLVEWNKKINLTAITDIKEVINKHFIDSITVSQSISFEENIKVIDIGTGAGFPGIPLKIVFPNISLTLLDSLNKRVNFLNEVVKSLNLEDVKCIHGRAEEYAYDIKYREVYDVCVSRAVAQMNKLSEYCLPFVKVGGKFIALKGPNISEEINKSKKAVRILGGDILNIQYVQISYTNLQHNLVIIKKIDCSPLKYPRKPSKIKKSPL